MVRLRAREAHIRTQINIPYSTGKGSRIRTQINIPYSNERMKDIGTYVQDIFCYTCTTDGTVPSRNIVLSPLL